MKTALVTGATSGFGKGLVSGLLDSGYQVIATGRDLTNRKDIFQSERTKFKSQLVELNLDVTSKEDLKSVETYFKGKPLDVLINNAGFAVFGPAEECSEEKLRQQFEVNVFGMFLITQKLLPSLRQAKGHIVNFSSVFGIMGFPLSSVYCSSKYAVEGFSESLSYELKPYEVKVTLIEPGGYRTNFNANAVWGMAETKPETQTNSIYAKQIANYTKLRLKMASRANPQNPDDVVRGVIDIIKSHNPKISYTFGKDAFSIKLFKKLVTRSMFHKVSGKILYKAFNKEQ